MQLTVLDRPRKLRQRFGRVRLSIFSVIVGLAIVGTAILVIFPIVRLLYWLFAENGLGSNESLHSIFTDPRLGPALFNTAFVIVVAGLSSLIVGALLAWLNERTDVRMGWTADLLPIIPLLIPPLASAIGWVLLLQDRAGFLNYFIRQDILHEHSLLASGPINIESLGGMTAIMALCVVPFPYLVVSAALRNTDPALEEASRIFGAGALRTILRVTFPSIRNALVTASVLLVMTLIAMFSVPIVIGSGARIDTLSVIIFNEIYGQTPPQLGGAVVLSVFMLAVVQVAVLFEYVVLRRGRHATTGGRAHVRNVIHLGPARWIIRAVIILYLLIATVAPLIGLALVSLQGFWNDAVDWASLSLSNYAQLFSAQYGFRSALFNSLGLAFAAATVLMIVASLIGFFIQGAPKMAGRALNGVTVLPASVPNTVVAVAFLISFGVSDFFGIQLGGTLMILFLCYIVLFLPVASRAAGSALAQIGRDMWEVSLMSGASRVRTFGRVILPLSWFGLVGGWVVVFAQVLPEVNAGAFLSSSTSNPVVGPVILSLWQQGGNFTILAALTLLITLIQAILVLLILRVGHGRRSVLRGA